MKVSCITTSKRSQQKIQEPQENGKVDCIVVRVISGAFFEGDYSMYAATLLEAFSQLEDPRCCRGVRHLFTGMVVLALLGMLARIREMEVLVH